MSETIQPVISERDGVTLVLFGPEADSIYENSIQAFKDAVIAQVAAAPQPLVIVDLPHTKFFGSAFLAFLIHVRKAIVEREGARLVVSGLTPYCRTVVEMSQLDELWELADSLDAALGQLQTD
jgi:anti-anti-sigma regulatory factor